MQLYHAHIYFKLSDLEVAKTLMASALASNVFHLVEIYEKPIGPHPLPTLELHFFGKTRAEARAFLFANQSGLSILIHEETGNDVRDHSENIEWLGTPVPIDFKFFDLILKRPDLRVHPVKS